MVKVKDLENKSDPTLIKNPFVCNSAFQVRMGLDKDPRSKIGNTDFSKECPLSNGNTLMINELDPKLEYMIGKETQEKDITSFSNMDYQVPPEILNQTSKIQHKEGLPLSFLQVKTEEEGLEWYKGHFPKIPDELLPIICRYHWGEPITKKSIKNEKKKIKKKIDKAGLTMSNKKVELNFD
tara:strand:- start:4188 stop:4730 length:543 start_codon:yes stop_codon:yes gene_type:complete